MCSGLAPLMHIIYHVRVIPREVLRRELSYQQWSMKLSRVVANWFRVAAVHGWENVSSALSIRSFEYDECFNPFGVRCFTDRDRIFF